LPGDVWGGAWRRGVTGGGTREVAWNKRGGIGGTNDRDLTFPGQLRFWKLAGGKKKKKRGGGGGGPLEKNFSEGTAPPKRGRSGGGVRGEISKKTAGPGENELCTGGAILGRGGGDGVGQGGKFQRGGETKSRAEGGPIFLKRISDAPGGVPEKGGFRGKGKKNRVADKHGSFFFRKKWVAKRGKNEGGGANERSWGVRRKGLERTEKIISKTKQKKNKRGKKGKKTFFLVGGRS